MLVEADPGQPENGKILAASGQNLVALAQGCGVDISEGGPHPRHRSQPRQRPRFGEGCGRHGRLGAGGLNRVPFLVDAFGKFAAYRFPHRRHGPIDAKALFVRVHTTDTHYNLFTHTPKTRGKRFNWGGVPHTKQHAPGTRPGTAPETLAHKQSIGTSRLFATKELSHKRGATI